MAGRGRYLGARIQALGKVPARRASGQEAQSQGLAPKARACLCCRSHDCAVFLHQQELHAFVWPRIRCSGTSSESFGGKFGEAKISPIALAQWHGMGHVQGSLAGPAEPEGPPFLVQYLDFTRLAQPRPFRLGYCFYDFLVREVPWTLSRLTNL